MTKGPSDSAFNNHGKFRDIHQQDMRYLDAFECDSYEDTNYLISTCVVS